MTHPMYREATRIVLRRAREDECESAYQIKRAALKPHLEKTGIWNDGEQRQHHERRFTTQDYRFVCVDDAPVGIMGLVVGEANVCLNQFYLLPDWQGRGVGGRALSLLLDEAGRLSRRVRLQVMKDNPRGFAFYLRMGFATVDESATHYTMVRDGLRGEPSEPLA